jgi:hypothetical protein
VSSFCWSEGWILDELDLASERISMNKEGCLWPS